MKTLAIILFCILFFGTAAAVLGQVVIPPGPNASPASPYGSKEKVLNFITDFYNFALALGSILAFGVIVYGGVRYTLAAGNPSGQSDAKEWITQALIGLLLLLGAVLILRTIHPDLGKISLPGLRKIRTAEELDYAACLKRKCPIGMTCKPPVTVGVEATCVTVKACAPANCPAPMQCLSRPDNPNVKYCAMLQGDYPCKSGNANYICGGKPGCTIDCAKSPKVCQWTSTGSGMGFYCYANTGAEKPL